MEKLSSLYETKENYGDVISRGAAWIDPTFAHDDSVAQDLGGPFNWLRASKLFNSKEKIYDSFSPNDIEQGMLGDCYFLSAVSSLAEFPGRVEKLFLQQDRNSAGCYVVRLFLYGRFVDIVLDDYFPADPYNRPAFVGTKAAELWVMLLEKAWAKLHGNYSIIEGGDSRESFVALTGAPTEFYKHSEQKPDKLWELIKAADEECYVMNAGATMEVKGIIKNHAYSLVNAYEIVDRGEKVRLLQIRNPWGSNEWEGEWCDKDPRWTAGLNKQLNHVSQEDGMFFMPFKDFITVFSHMFICKARDDYVHSSLFVEAKKAFAVFEVPTKTKGFISAYQITDRQGKILVPGYALSLLKVELYKIESNVVRMIDGCYSNALGQANIEVELEPGIYVVKAAFEKATKLPWISFCGYTDNAVEFVKMDVNDIYEVNYQNASQLVRTPTLDTTVTKKKKVAGGFRKCLEGHVLQWSIEVPEGVETYVCEGCKKEGSPAEGWWVCNECKYQICAKCRPEVPHREKRKGKRKEQVEDKKEPENEKEEEKKEEVNVMKCGKDHEMNFVPVDKPNSLYLCDNCGKAFYGNVRRWSCEACSYDICRECVSPPEEFKDEQVTELENCPKGHKLSFVIANTRKGTYECRLCGKFGLAQNGRWQCNRCNVNICITCKPSEAAAQKIVATDVTTMTCAQDHSLAFSCRAPQPGKELNCAKCKKKVDSSNWRWTCEACNYNICSKCRPAPEGRKDLICPEMHMLIQSNLPQNNSNYGRCDCCFKSIKYADGRYCCLPCNYEFCNKCIAKVWA